MGAKAPGQRGPQRRHFRPELAARQLGQHLRRRRAAHQRLEHRPPTPRMFVATEEHGVTEVAMESTGVYWKPIYYVLEDAFTCLLRTSSRCRDGRPSARLRTDRAAAGPGGGGAFSFTILLGVLERNNAGCRKLPRQTNCGLAGYQGGSKGTGGAGQHALFDYLIRL
jgi:hypothetical protein